MTGRATLDDAARLLEDHYGFTGKVDALAGGLWSAAFTFTRHGCDLVVRLGADLVSYNKDRLAGTWSNPMLPIPAVLDVGTFDGRAFAISERCAGDPLETLDRAGWRRVLPSLFDALDALRAVEAPAGGWGTWSPSDSPGPDSWRAWLEAGVDPEPGSHIDGWRDRLEALPGAGDRYARSCTALLDRTRCCPEVRNIIHSDLTAGNVVVSGSRVSGIFDWANFLIGDPLYELAGLTFWAPWIAGLDSSDLDAMIADRYSGVEADLESRLRCYETHIGVCAQQFNAWSKRWDELERSATRTLTLAG